MIGVVGTGPNATRLAEFIEDAGESPIVGDAAAVAEASPTAIVAAGEAAVIDVVRTGVDVPVLPVDVDIGLGRPTDGDEKAIGRVLAGEFDARSIPLLESQIDGEPVGRAVFDVMLDTSEPSRISEYAVEADGSTDRFRADGVVVATPAGSRGYANAAGGPVLASGVGAVAVVPIAAFELGADRRVVKLPVALTVERDECPVSLLVDGREAVGIDPDRPVEVATGGTLDVVDPRS